jgi:FixJ family two-component response regulator
MTSATLRIYVIDDDESARLGLGRLLRSAGFQVKIFGSAQEFLDHGNKLPIIFITGFEDPRARDEALKSGAIAFLQKPMDEQTLLDAIQAASQRQANRN